MASIEIVSTQPTPNPVEFKMDWTAYSRVLLTGPLGLKVPEDAPVWHSNVIHDLCVSMFVDQPCLTLQETPPLGPEFRFRWFDTCLLQVCTRVHPIFWAWTSDESAPVRIDQVHAFESVGLQLQLHQTLLLELEHVLAQDWFQWCLHQGLTDGPYERRESIFCRPDGCVFLALQTTETQRGGTLIKSSTLPPRAQETLALIGFGLGRRFVSPDYACQIDSIAGGSIEQIEFGSNIPSLHSGWQEFEPSANVAVVEDMA